MRARDQDWERAQGNRSRPKYRELETGVSIVPKPTKNQGLGRPGGGLIGAKHAHRVKVSKEDTDAQSSGGAPTAGQLLFIPLLC